MQVDEESKSKIIDMLMTETNLRDIIMTSSDQSKTQVGEFSDDLMDENDSATTKSTTQAAQP